jgi:hypothetical protein
MISGSDEPPIGQIMTTNIIDVIATVFKFQDVSEDIAFMKMEAVWILTNLVYGSEKDIEQILNPQFEILYTLNIFLSHSNPAMVEQSLWFFGNAIAES